MAKNVVVSLSGGMDSSTLLLRCLSEYDNVTALSFDYGQKHRVELLKAQSLINWTVLTLSADQVRQPLYVRAVGRHARWGGLLDPLRTGLGDAITRYEAGDALWRRFRPGRAWAPLIRASAPSVLGRSIFDRAWTGRWRGRRARSRVSHRSAGDRSVRIRRGSDPSSHRPSRASLPRDRSPGTIPIPSISQARRRDGPLGANLSERAISAVWKTLFVFLIPPGRWPSEEI